MSRQTKKEKETRFIFVRDPTEEKDLREGAAGLGISTRVESRDPNPVYLDLEIGVKERWGRKELQSTSKR